MSSRRYASPVPPRQPNVWVPDAIETFYRNFERRAHLCEA